MTNQEVIIIGGGVSGLIAAQCLESQGVTPTLIEKENWGGRVGTDQVEGAPLDHGFQVLLTAYPMAKKYLDYPTLDLVRFQPGTYIYSKENTTYFGDPLREFSALFSTINAPMATLSDKWKVFQLKREVTRKSVEQIFQYENKSTLGFLQDYGFSNKIIQGFFTPFFGGIFLEKKLLTSCRMFLFVFKMFSEGHAAVPRKGMSAITEQLSHALKNTQRIHGRAEIQEDGSVTVDGESFGIPKVVIKAHADFSKTTWNSSTTFYFEVDRVPDQKNAISLWGGQEIYRINSWHYLNHLFPGMKQNIVSITVVEDELPLHELQKTVQQEFEEITGIKIIKKIKAFSIPHSLPMVEEPRWTTSCPTSIQGDTTIVHCGDHHLFGSLNAAMHSGELAAEGALRVLGV